MTTLLEVFSDYVCPWCYLGSARVTRLQEDWDIDVRIVHFPLHLETPEEGQSLEQLFAGRDVDVAQMQERMAAIMRAEGLEYGDRRRTYNSHRAQQLASWTIAQEGGEAIHQALFFAYFVEDVNLADIDRLVDIAAGIGLDPDRARGVLRSRGIAPPSPPTGSAAVSSVSPACPPTVPGTVRQSGRSPTKFWRNSCRRRGHRGAERCSV